MKNRKISLSQENNILLNPLEIIQKMSVGPSFEFQGAENLIYWDDQMKIDYIQNGIWTTYRMSFLNLPPSHFFRTMYLTFDKSQKVEDTQDYGMLYSYDLLLLRKDEIKSFLGEWYFNAKDIIIEHLH